VGVLLWNTVAATRGKTDPDDAVEAYRRLLSHAVAVGTRGVRYRDAN
jgi:hypothetical protein